MFFDTSYDYNSYNEDNKFALSETEFDMESFLIESTEEWYTIREKMIRAEHVAIVNEDAQLLSEATDGFFAKVKAWFIKMWNAIKNFFKKALAWFSSFFTKSDQWVKKYEKQLMAIPSDKLKGKKITLFALNESKLDELTNSISDISKIHNSKTLFSGDDLTENKLQISKECFVGEETAAEAKKAIIGSKEPVDLGMNYVRDAIQELKISSKVVRDVEKMRNMLDKIYRDMIREVEASSKARTKKANDYAAKGNDNKAEREGRMIDNESKIIELYRHTATCKNQSVNIVVSILKIGASQAIAICRKALAATPSKAMSESTSLFNSIEENVLDRF